ncbi:assimilatory nitrate reductase (NADH) alpha subunit apoprotein [Isoptericola jiangsuensis]|uniref:Assimilatory nitrate reductase (NADH) alpha subunit apoprotein n=1 Tax=Isoptericola jiangsuensis TaxID=548579 RepID=A0A2A9F026_9MICO|nr:molybdopterin oxidoreductase family protein [Isoptericola jiangsuensis]PFG43912.1 assimilatory nitrate reductase (NADH) alpha subunit apoprotein [Isoptericola jiangsuensis]
MTATSAAPAQTHCPYCALQCGMALTPAGEPLAAPDGRAPLPVTVAPRDFPTNAGGLCQKGWTSASVLTVPDRITTPLLRGPDGELAPASWEAALDVVAAGVRRVQAAHGPDGVAVFGGGGLTNEKAYALGKFARTVLRTSRIDYNGRFCMSSAAAAGNRAFGADRGLPFPLTDLGGAQAVLLLGSNPAETMPPFVQHLAGAREAGGLVVVDPRRSATARLTDDDQGIHLQPVPGTDMVVLLALTHVVVAEGLVDRAFVDERTTGHDAVVRAVSAWWPERAETVCGVPAPTLRRVARLLAAASPARGGRGAYVLTGRGVEQSAQGTATVTAAIDLALLLGLVGRPGSGYGCLTGQGNGQGGREHGQKSDQLPGYRKIDDPAARAHVAAVWGVEESTIPGPGLPAVALLDALGRPGGPQALFVHGSNVLVSAPNADRVRERLAALDLLVVCDFVPSETAMLADVVLPVTQWAEEEGTMTSLEGRVIRRRQAVDAPGEARSELWILAELARRLGSDVAFPTEPAVVFDELARASRGGVADYSGLSHARLDADEDAGGAGLYWPCPAPGPDGAEHPGTPRMFLDGFPTPDGRARLVAVDHLGPTDDVRADAPTYLVTGRVLQHYQSGAQTRRVAELDRLVPEPYVEIHPYLGLRVGVGDGERARVRSVRGEVEAVARWTDAVRPEVVFMPFHWGGTGSVNRVTSDAVDPVSAMPEFKVCAVVVEPATPPRPVTGSRPDPQEVPA